MSHPLKHPKARALLKRVAQSFRAEDTYILHDSNIVFVCGGSMDGPYMRPRFYEYASANLPQLHVFLAENAQQDYVQHVEPEFHNVAKFEDIIAEISTCVVIFPESPGSFTELGYFSKNDKLRKKILVINNADLQGQDSFVALGPITLIDSDSEFRPTIQIVYSANPDFSLVKERFDNRLRVHNRRRLGATTYKSTFPR